MSPGRPRSGFGQASSNDAGGGSASSAGEADGLGRISADSISGGNGSLVRACARSRSFREVDENNKLRLALGAGGAAAAGSSSGGGGRSREPASSCHGEIGRAHV